MTSSKGLNSLKSKSEATSGIITAIQRYSTKDGPGIRTTVFMKGCTLQCEWCSNPEAISPHPELMVNHGICVHCGDCAPACPTHAFSIIEGSLSFDQSMCDACGDCVTCCPEEALEIVGWEVTKEEVLEEVFSDIVFYEVSGGGVTFSGGEPLLQSEFIRDVASEVVEENIHVAIDTAGNVPWRFFEMVLPYTDLFLFDLKFFDHATHKRHTGVDNRLILENALKLAERGIPVIVRLVILPGLNDSYEEIRSRLGFIQELSNVKQVDLLPYHKLGVAKYERLGKMYPQPDLNPPDQGWLDSLSEEFIDKGYTVTVGG
jgi:pyruvate formate lyase activating enzyme